MDARKEGPPRKPCFSAQVRAIEGVEGGLGLGSRNPSDLEEEGDWVLWGRRPGACAAAPYPGQQSGSLNGARVEAQLLVGWGLVPGAGGWAELRRLSGPLVPRSSLMWSGG